MSGNMLTQEQQEWLNRRIANRPPRKSLTDRNVLPEGNYSGNFSNIQQTLKRNMDKDQLSRSLDQRPNIQHLMKTGILERHHHAVSPALAATARKLERTFLADELNQKLYTRQDVEMLQKRGILRSTDIAPSLHQKRRELELAIRKDQLNHMLYSRPERHEIVAKGYLPSGNRSSAVAQKMKELEYSMKRDKIGHLLENRTQTSALQNSNVMRSPQISSILQAKQAELSKNLVKSNLYHALKSRPSIDELQQKGYYPKSWDEEEDDRLRGYNAPAEYKKSTVQPKLDQSQQEYLQRRSKNFHLTRILLKFVASMGQAGKISLDQKGQLKDLIVDQDKTILAVAETFDVENDLNDFEDSLIRLASRKTSPLE